MINKIFKNKIKGFTLIETMVAVFIISIAIVSMVGAISKSFLASIYARNQITATYLIQEAVDYIRNDRDTSVIFGNTSWTDFASKYNACSGSDGCYINILTNSINSCSTNPDTSFGDIKCPRLTFNENGTPYYSYSSSGTGVYSNFKRKILVKRNTDNSDQIDVTVSVEWKNGNFVRSRSLEYSLLNWTKK